MNICFLVSQNAELFQTCKDALAKVASSIELRMLSHEADYQKAAAARGVALVIVDCTDFQHNDLNFDAEVRKRVRVIQTHAAIPVIYANPNIETTTQTVAQAGTIHVSTSASLKTWENAITRALNITATWQFHGDIDEIFDEIIVHKPSQTNMLSPDELLESAKPFEMHQFDIHLSEAWTTESTASPKRHSSATLVQNISFNDAYGSNPRDAHRKAAPAHKPPKLSLLDRLLKNHKSATPQGIPNFNTNGMLKPPAVPKLIRPNKISSFKQAERLQVSQTLRPDHVLPPDKSMGFDIALGHVTDTVRTTDRDIPEMLTTDHVQPPEASTGFDIEIGHMAEPKSAPVPMLPPENILPLGENSADMPIVHADEEDHIQETQEKCESKDICDATNAPEMLDPEAFRPQNSAMFTIGGAFQKNDEDNAPEMIDPEAFRPQNSAMFNIGGAFQKNDEDNAPEMLDPEAFRPQNSAMFTIGGAFQKNDEDNAPEMLDPEAFKPQNSAMFTIGGAFQKNDEDNAPEMLDPEAFKPQHSAMFNTGGAFQKNDEDNAPEMLDPEAFKPQHSAMFTIGGAWTQRSEEENSAMLPAEEIRQALEAEKNFDLNLGHALTQAKSSLREHFEMMQPEDLLASAENGKVPFDFKLSPAQYIHPEASHATSKDDFEDEADFIPPFRLENDDWDVSDIHAQRGTSESLDPIAALIESTMQSVLRKWMDEELLPKLEQRMDAKIEMLKAHLLAQSLTQDSES